MTRCLITTRRGFLALSTGAATALGAAGRRPVIHFSFDNTLANDGEWGGAIVLEGPAAGNGVLLAREGRGAADLTGEWAQAGGGRLIYEDARLAAVDSFSAAVSFNPQSLDHGMTILSGMGRWQIRLSGNGTLSVATYYSATKSQGSIITRLTAPDSWYQIAIAFDRGRQRLEFAFRQVGDESSLATGGFRVVPETFGPSAPKTQIMEIGSAGGRDPFFGYIDNLSVYDHAPSADGLRGLLESGAHALAGVGGLPFELCILPVERDSGVLLPARSDVAMSSRRWHPRDASDPNDTMRDLAAFRATRLEWCSSREATPEHIRQVKDAGIAFCSKVGASDNSKDRVASARDFEGRLLAFRWMVSWTQSDGLPPGASCVNNAHFRASLAERITQLVKVGVVGVQYDDWASNISVLSSDGGCLCEFCMQKFRAYLKANHAAADLERWGAGNPDQFDYRQFLKTQRRVTNAQEYLTYYGQNASDPLQQAYVRFQHASVRDGLVALKAVLAANAPAGGRRPALSVNAHFGSSSQQSKGLMAGDLPDYFVGEAGDETLVGMFVNAKIAEALHRVSILSPFPYKVDRTRSEIALQCALGQLCLAPYDIWMQTSDLPRHFGKAADYADLFGFVRGNAELFDACETVVTVGIAVDTSKPEDKRFRPLVQALAEGNVPFVLLLLGRGYFDPYISPLWSERLQTLINLTDATDLKVRFPNARIWPGELKPELLRRISVLGVEAQNVVATVRAKPGAGKFVAVHLVNQNFDEFSRAVPVEQCGVRLLQRRFWGPISRVELLAPGLPAQSLTVKLFGRDLRMVVPELRTWAVLRIMY